MTAPLSSIGIAMPPWFNSAAHDSVHGQLALQKPSHEAEWMSFGIAWKGVAYRLKAASDCDAAFTSSIVQFNSPPPEDRYAQENALFGFFSNALSAIECFYYAAYCIGAIITPARFPAATPKDLKKVSPSNVASLFNAAFAGEPLASQMQSVIIDMQFVEISDIRNVLSHRGVPPRHFYQGGENHGKAMMPANPRDPAAQWNYSLELTATTTSSRLQWLATIMASLLSKTDSFCRARLVT